MHNHCNSSLLILGAWNSSICNILFQEVSFSHSGILLALCHLNLELTDRIDSSTWVSFQTWKPGFQSSLTRGSLVVLVLGLVVCEVHEIDY